MTNNNSANAPHTGEYLAQLMTKSLTAWGIQDQVLSVICDNASANDVMVKKLSEHEWKRFGETGRVRCFAHVLNLVVGVSRIKFMVFKRLTFLDV